MRIQKKRCWLEPNSLSPNGYVLDGWTWGSPKSKCWGPENPLENQGTRPGHELAHPPETILLPND